MNIVIIGSGAIGLLWSHYLLQASSVNLSLSVRTPHQSFVHKAVTPFSYTHLSGYSTTAHIRIATAHDMANADILLVCVKAYDVKTALKQYLNVIAKHCKIILCHNGMGIAEEVLSLGFDATNIITALTTHGALKAHKYHVIHTGLGHCDIGFTFQNKASIPSTIKQLSQAMPPIYWHKERHKIISKQWVKLAINCIINPITAINNINNGKVVEQQYQELIDGLAQEISAVAASQHLNLCPQFITDMTLAVAQKTAANTSSMRADILSNRRTEIDYINGYIVQLGIKHGIATPYNVTLRDKLISLSKGY